MKKIIYFVILLVVTISCQPPEVGYISDDIHALEDTVFIPRGVFMTSATPASEGSAYPLSWSITEVYDAAGNPTTALYDKHEILVWKAAFNGDTDTTLALAEAKLELKENPTLMINEVSGQMAFTQASKFVQNDIFKVDVKVSNVRGERQLNDFVILKFQPFKPVEIPVPMISRIRLVKNDGSYNNLFSSTIQNDYDAAAPSVLNGTHPYINITKTSAEPGLGIKARMVIADSDDKPFSPSRVLFYPSGGGYLQNYHDNSVETVDDATGTTFSLPAPPFPQFGRDYSGNNTYLMYYITSRDAFTIDKAAWEAANGPHDWSQYQTDPVTGNVICDAYIRFAVKINDSGSWQLKMRIPYSKKLN